MASVPQTQLCIRGMLMEDLPRVLGIENSSYDFPWTPGIFRDCLRVGYHCEVLEYDGGVCGYVIYSVAVGECHVLNLCVDAQYRRLGFASMLLAGVMRHSAMLGARQIYLEVRPSNGGAIALYAALGFRQLGRRRNYYPAARGREDALILVRVLPLGDGEKYLQDDSL